MDIRSLMGGDAWEQYCHEDEDIKADEQEEAMRDENGKIWGWSDIYVGPCSNTIGDGKPKTFKFRHTPKNMINGVPVSDEEFEQHCKMLQWQQDEEERHEILLRLTPSEAVLLLTLVENACTASLDSVHQSLLESVYPEAYNEG